MTVTVSATQVCDGATIAVPLGVSSRAAPAAEALLATSMLHLHADAPFTCSLPPGAADGQQLRIIVIDGDADTPITLAGALFDAGLDAAAVALYVGDSLQASWSDAGARWTLARGAPAGSPQLALPSPPGYSLRVSPRGVSVLHVDTTSGPAALTLEDGVTPGQLYHVGIGAGARTASLVGAGVSRSIGASSAALLAWTGAAWGDAVPGIPSAGDVVTTYTVAPAQASAPVGYGLLSVNSSSRSLRITLPSTPGGTAGVARALRFAHIAGANGVTYLTPGGVVLGSSVAGSAWTALWSGTAWTRGVSDTGGAPYVPSGAPASVVIPAAVAVAWISTAAGDVRVAPPPTGAGAVRLLKSGDGATPSTGGALLLTGTGMSIPAGETALPALTVSYANGAWVGSLGASPLAANTMVSAPDAAWVAATACDVLLVDAAAGSLRLLLPSLSAPRAVLVAREDTHALSVVTLSSIAGVSGGTLSLGIGGAEASLVALTFAPTPSPAWSVAGIDRYGAATVVVPPAAVVVPRRTDIVLADTSLRDITLTLPTQSTALLSVCNVGSGPHVVQFESSTPFLGSPPVVAPSSAVRLAFHGGARSTHPSYGLWVTL